MCGGSIGTRMTMASGPLSLARAVGRASCALRPRVVVTRGARCSWHLRHHPGDTAVAARRRPTHSCALAASSPARVVASQQQRGAGMSSCGVIGCAVRIAGRASSSSVRAPAGRRGIVNAAKKGDDDDAQGVLAPEPSAAEAAEMEKEAKAFAASWASELSAAAWTEMQMDDEVRQRPCRPSGP